MTHQLLKTALSSYTAPLCRVKGILYEDNFLASDDFGEGGYPGSDLGDGGEYEF